MSITLTPYDRIYSNDSHGKHLISFLNECHNDILIVDYVSCIIQTEIYILCRCFMTGYSDVTVSINTVAVFEWTS